MTPSAAQTRNKRVRVDPTAATIPDPSDADTSVRLKVPKARASAAIAAHTETLLPQLSTILKNLGESHLDLLHRYYNKNTQLLRMEPDETIIPRSARLKFELSVPKSIEELPDFITLKEQCDSDITAMKATLKAHVISALKIEVNFYSAELTEHLATVLHTATAALLIANGNADVNHHRAVAHLIMAHSDELLKHVHTNADGFRLVYTRKHAIPTFPTITAPTAPPTATNNTGASTYFTVPHQAAPPITIESIPQLDLIFRTICCIFISPFDQYIDQHRANQIELSLKKLVEEELTVAATAEAQMEVEAEDSVSRTLLNELVQKETKKNTLKLSSEIAALRQTIQSLKGPRGPKPTKGASQKRNLKPTKATQRNRNAKADAAGRASSNASSKNSAAKKKKSTRKKKPASKTGKTKS